MTTKTYTCAQCRETFESEWSDEEALTEMGQNFGAVAEEERVVVCDDCYRVMVRIAPPPGYVSADPHGDDDA